MADEVGSGAHHSTTVLLCSADQGTVPAVAVKLLVDYATAMSLALCPADLARQRVMSACPPVECFVFNHIRPVNCDLFACLEDVMFSGESDKLLTMKIQDQKTSRKLVTLLSRTPN